MRAIAAFERTHFGPGSTARALTTWSKFVHGTIRAINGPAPDSSSCPCCEDDGPDEHRTILRLALHALPAQAARELMLLVRPLDELYLSRSYPRPDNADLRAELTVE
ncbi:hypothetical protein GCM10017774_49980 [Lentzea cavernae]|uniref:Uncharacterized protein n=2 Tax=Lentzea cavernae TaxID=2020703 RepID=A0ABQ3MKH0_9PSEU|nr:hypothetical protein GCM10017774_49980 [Lentzea cavernae]